jgi:hypothetical protein
MTSPLSDVSFMFFPMDKTQRNESVCDPKADITLRSSDDVLFKFYKKHLEVHSEAFASAEGFPVSETEEIHFTETSEVLDLLLQFMSRQKPPDLTSLKFETLASLSEAVEKYQVFSAMTACEMNMKYSRYRIDINRNAEKKLLELQALITHLKYWRMPPSMAMLTLST